VFAGASVIGVELSCALDTDGETKTPMNFNAHIAREILLSEEDSYPLMTPVIQHPQMIYNASLTQSAI
jgi:hypothetical protein